MNKPLCENGCGRRTEVYGCRFCPGCYPVASPMLDQVRQLELDRDRYAEQARALAEEVERLRGLIDNGAVAWTCAECDGLQADPPETSCHCMPTENKWVKRILINAGTEDQPQ